MYGMHPLSHLITSLRFTWLLIVDRRASAPRARRLVSSLALEVSQHVTGDVIAKGPGLAPTASKLAGTVRDPTDT
jgi:hypothetical protein